METYVTAINEGFEISEEIDLELARLRKLSSGDTDAFYENGVLTIKTNWRQRNEIEATITITKEEVLQRVFDKGVAKEVAISELIKEKVAFGAYVDRV